MVPSAGASVGESALGWATGFASGGSRALASQPANSSRASRFAKRGLDIGGLRARMRRASGTLRLGGGAYRKPPAQPRAICTASADMQARQHGEERQPPICSTALWASRAKRASPPPAAFLRTSRAGAAGGPICPKAQAAR
jgi:hypothetical protein